MKKLTIIIVIYLFVIITSSIVVTYYKNLELGNELFPDSTNRKIKMKKVSDVEKTNIYCSMVDIENYPVILSEYISSVKIINQTENVVFAEENIENAWINSKALVKHSFFPYDRHLIEIMDGEAEGSKIDIAFEEFESGTKLSAKIDLKVKGTLAPFALIPDIGIRHGILTVFTPFENEAMNKDFTC